MLKRRNELNVIYIEGFENYDSINIDILKTVNEYFKPTDYIILYSILIIMSFLTSIRYSRKLFDTSVMNSYREEV